MTGLRQISVGILGTGSAVPDVVLTNKQLEDMVETSDEWITSRTGIKERRIAKEDEAASDFAYKAAVEALKSANLKPEDIDLILVATITPDMLFPSTACIVQDRLGASEAAAFDLSAGCSGFVYALEVGCQMVRGGYKHVLVIGADVLSKVTDYEDRSTCVLFGDGAGACVLGEVEEGFGILATNLGADGSGANVLCLEAGGSRMPASEETVRSKKHFITMIGNEVFKFAVRIMGQSTLEVLKRANINPEQIRWFIPHQANIRIIQAAAQRLGLDDESVYVNVDRYGNTSAASIPIALDELVKMGKVEHGDNLLTVGFGAGLTWGSAIIRWQEDVK